MTKDDIIKLLVFYDGYFEGKSVEAKKDTSIINEEHVRWMCQEAQTLDDEGKMNRWLGFIQGYLWLDDFSIDEMREHNTQADTTSG